MVSHFVLTGYEPGALAAHQQFNGGLLVGWVTRANMPELRVPELRVPEPSKGQSRGQSRGQSIDGPVSATTQMTCLPALIAGEC